MHCADALEFLKLMPPESIHCCITSPPYWGLRDYKIESKVWSDGWKGCLGLEPTPEMYIEHLVQIFREIKRVLRKDGTLWLNLGDSYAGSAQGWGHEKQYAGPKQATNRGSLNQPLTEIKIGFQRPPGYISSKQKSGLKPKDLCGIPWRVALALQADGWWLRSDIIWSKPNPMPESVRDRPTRSHEYIFLLTKSAKYYFDSEAVKENYSDSYLNDLRHITGSTDRNEKNGYLEALAQNPKKLHRMFDKPIGTGRNIRSVWTITTKPFKEAHFATFPPELPERCIKAGTSEKGVCPKCGAPWVRIIEKSGGTIGKGWTNHSADMEQGMSQKGCAGLGNKKNESGEFYQVQTLGWRPSCKCNAGESIPAIVFDPFAGAGTTGMEAKRLGRNYIIVDIKPEYCEMTRKRIAKVGYQMEIEERLAQGVL
jgi:DNA modification methylase